MFNYVFKKSFVILILFLFLFSSVVSGLKIKINDNITSYEHVKTLYVGGTGLNNYTKIQDAIDNASSGDTVFLFPGIYHEHIMIYTSFITLTSENKIDTIIDGDEYWFTIKIENNIDERISNIKINNITVKNASYYGIYVRFSDVINISNSIVRDNGYCGIYVEYSDYSVYEFNQIFNNTWWDLYLEFSCFCKICYNHISYGRTGIRTESCNENEFLYNEISNHSHYGIHLVRHAYLTLPNKIHHNNFINNDINARFQDCNNIWYRNFWDDSKIIHVIIGSFYFILTSMKIINITTLEFDLLIAKEPYNI
jgi:parallel beta-helix repeat protein